MGIRILKSGLQTTIQDLGRRGFQKYGMPVSGAMDTLAFRLGNILLGNSENEGALECTMVGPQLYFDTDQLICLTGADLTASIGGQPVPLWKPIYVESGSILSFGATQLGCRTYICFFGGLDITLILKSQSTYLPAKVGGFQGRSLQKNDYIPFKQPYHHSLKVFHWSLDTRLYPDLTIRTIRVMLGPHFYEFEEESRELFFNSLFGISFQSNRIGYRLESKRLQFKANRNLLSSAVTFGTIQVPAQGQPIILMADHGTTGGYPIIAQVASIDLPLLAQLKPDDRIDFELITMEEAQDLWKKQDQYLRILKQGIIWKYGQ